MYMIGILIGLYLKISVVFFLIIWCLIGIILYLFNVRKSYILFGIIIFLAFFHINFLEKNYEEKIMRIPDTVNIEGIIVSAPEDKEYKYTYMLKVSKINGDEDLKNIKLILDIKKTNSINGIPNFGDKINIIGTFEKPNQARNYKGFDYKEYLKSKGIYGVIEVEQYKIVGKNKVDRFNQLIHKIQNSMKTNMEAILEKEEAALCVGILVGNREGISAETEDNFKRSNLTHMLAVSGSHITYIITAFSIMLGKTNKKFGKFFTIVFLIFFMALTGFTASVVRASIMGIIVLIASIIHRRSDTINNLGISSLIMFVYNPYVITDIAFWLSYAGTIGIILLFKKTNNFIYNLISKITKDKVKLNNIEGLNEDLRSKLITIGKKVLRGVIDSFCITLSANILIIPVMAYSFSTISITFWLSNILAGPVMEFATIYGFIVYFISLIFLPLAKFLGGILNLSLTILLKIAEISSLIPGASIYIKTPYLISCIFYYFFVFLVFNIENIKKQQFFSKIRNKMSIYFQKRKIKTVAIFILIIFSVHIISDLFFLKVEVYFVDVGQGDCTLIKTPKNKYILIDGGGSEFGNFDVGESILLPYLLDRRITKIDYLLISHFDSDHIGGLFYILGNINIRNIIISKQGENSSNLIKLKEFVKKKKINLQVVKKGDYIKIDKYSYFEILFPEEELIQDNILNNNSIVTRFCSLGLKMLFTGDIEEIAEKRLCELYEGTNKLEAEVLKVAHHGSKTSSTLNFLNLVNPKIAFIGVGEDNKFGHPNDGVLSRIKKFTNLIYRTDKNGEIVLKYYNGKFKINTIM